MLFKGDKKMKRSGLALVPNFDPKVHVFFEKNSSRAAAKKRGMFEDGRWDRTRGVAMPSTQWQLLAEFHAEIIIRKTSPGNTG
jgi:hypothetical protein